MINPLLLDIALYLINNGVAQEDGVDIFRDFSPEEPDNVIVLYEYKGSDIVPYEEKVHRSVQVSVRDIDADIAREKALSIFKLLQSDTHVVHFTNDRWGQVYLRQTPFKIKIDNNARTVYGFNVGITTDIE